MPIQILPQPPQGQNPEGREPNRQDNRPDDNERLLGQPPPPHQFFGADVLQNQEELPVAPANQDHVARPAAHNNFQGPQPPAPVLRQRHHPEGAGQRQGPEVFHRNPRMILAGLNVARDMVRAGLRAVLDLVRAGPEIERQDPEVLHLDNGLAGLQALPEGLLHVGPHVFAPEIRLQALPEGLHVGPHVFAPEMRLQPLPEGLELQPPVPAPGDPPRAFFGLEAHALDQATLEPLAAAPYPFPQIRILNLNFPRQFHQSIANQLRFFATMEGPAQNFSLSRGFREDGSTNATLYTPDALTTDMKSFVRDIIQTQPLKFIHLLLHDGETLIAAHGEHNPNMGKAIYSMSGEFRAALTVAYERGIAQGNHEHLRGLFEAISNWCLDGSITRLNQYFQENALSDIDLSLVPNLDHKETVEAKAAEFLRVFHLSQARLFEKETGQPAQDAQGELAHTFEKGYFHAALFANYLNTHESASALTAEERQSFLQSIREMELINELPVEPD